MSNKSNALTPSMKPAGGSSDKAVRAIGWTMAGLAAAFAVGTYMHLHGQLQSAPFGISMQLILQWVLGGIYALGGVMFVLGWHQHRAQRAADAVGGLKTGRVDASDAELS